jgi:hypothetical protein
MQVLGGATGKVVKGGVLGSVRSGPWLAKAGEVLQDSVCVYQAQGPGLTPIPATGNADRVVLGNWTVDRASDGKLSVKKSALQRAGLPPKTGL